MPEISIPDHSSFDRWHEATCRAFSLTECRNPAFATFQGRVEARGFGALSVSEVASFSADYPLAVERGQSEVRRDQRDDFMLYLVRSGEIGISQDGRTGQASVGDFFIYDQSLPFKLMLGDHAHGIVLTLPRGQTESRLSMSRQLTARSVSGASPLGLLARSIVSQLSQLGSQTELETASRIGSSVLDILATTLETQLNGREQTSDQRRLQHAKRYMLAELDNAALTINDIALEIDLAPRTIHRLFALENTTPIRWLWQQRLTASYEALAEGRVRKVTDAALNHGFADVSHFSRSFKKKFGRSPHTVARR